MQWNQPFGGYFSQNTKTESPPLPQIVGEGDVNAVTLPDGSVQLIFVPIIKQNYLPSSCYVKSPHGNLYSCPTTEVWFVRSIAYPQANLNIPVPTGYFPNQLSSVYGECPPYTPPNYNSNVKPPVYHEYTQKFHNDTWTSTTDIHYFYPSLRRAKCVQYSTETQTEMPYSNNIFTENCQCRRTCHCESSFNLKSSNNAHKTCHSKVQTMSSDSCMSVDNEDIRHHKNKKYKIKFMREKKSLKDICKCKMKIRDTSDKIVTTYVDQATENVTKDGRTTQTEAVKAKKQKSKAGNTKSILRWDSSSQSCCYYDSCTCSTSETER